MIIECISDLHGYEPKLHGGDLLIIAGDMTTRDTVTDWNDFFKWLSKQDYKKKIFIAGNHDNLAMSQFDWFDAEYLFDSGTEFEGLKIWGSPWTKIFYGMNPKCKAFTVDTEQELKEKWALIPDDIDILITHSPPYGIFDSLSRGEHVGSPSLRARIDQLPNLKLHCFGHIHEWGGAATTINGVKFINASQVNEVYEEFDRSVIFAL